MRSAHKRKSLSIMCILASVFVFSCGAVSADSGLQITRWIPEPVNLSVITDKPAQGFRDAEMKNPNVQFAPGTMVQLLVYTPEAYYVQGKSTDGNASPAWVSPLALSQISHTLLADAQDAEALRILLEAAIDRREIIIGMTAEDVRKSLGRPWRTEKGTKPGDPQETWIYIHYERAPRTEVFTGSDNLVYSQTTFQQIPAGRLKIALRNGRVTGYTVEVDQPEGFFDRRTDGNVIIRPDLNPILAPEDNPVP